MSSDFSHLNSKEQLRAENEFLKMKLMLEKGATFRTVEAGEQDLPPEVENEFLNNIIEFEKQWENPTYIKVFEKIGKPAHFLPAAQVPDEDIGKAWEELSEHLNHYGITLDACSPNVSARDLYRFTTEELFEVEMEDISIPGMIHGFIYDEFHPDPYYENVRIAVQHCMFPILHKDPIQWLFHFHRDEVRLNQYESLTGEELKRVVNHFKNVFDELEIKELAESGCVIEQSVCTVKGNFEVTGIIGKETCPLKGNWKVVLAQDLESTEWYITDVDIEGIRF
jgi:hypothetical protein